MLAPPLADDGRERPAYHGQAVPVRLLLGCFRGDRFRGALPRHDLAKGYQVGLAYAEQRTVAHDREGSRLDPALHGAGADVQQLGHVLGVYSAPPSAGVAGPVIGC
jgi:hypothetical protein